MQAMHGYSAERGRSHLRLLAIFVALLATTAAAAMPQVASATPKPKEPKLIYLALGDSLAFGYSQKQFNEYEKTGDEASSFEKGYVQDLYSTINAKKNYELVNLGCPGETTESLIGQGHELTRINELIDGRVKQPVTGEPVCAYHETEHHPLHREYGGGKSQLEAAIETIEKASYEGKKVKLVTLNIGANDELHFIKHLEQVEGPIAAGEWEHEHPAALAAEEAKAGEEAAIEYNAPAFYAELTRAEEEATAEASGYGAELARAEEEATGEASGYGAELARAEEEATGEASGYGAELAKAEQEATEEASGYSAELATAEENCLPYYGSEPAFMDCVGYEVETWAGEEPQHKEIEEKVPGKIETWAGEEPQHKEIEEKVTGKIETWAGEAPQHKEIEEKVTGKIETWAAEEPQHKEIEGKVEAKVETYIDGNSEIVAKATKKVEKFLGENAEVVAKATAKVTAEITAHYPELFAQITTNITGILSAIRAAGYSGKIVFDGGYDPYGKLVAHESEYLNGSNLLAGILNHEIETLVKGKTFKGCFADPKTIFNPEKEPQEEEDLKKFTNMDNTEVFEGKKDGPDIHPTPLGYEEIAKQLATVCKLKS